MENRSVDRVTLINISIFVEALILLVATFWSQHAGIALVQNLKLDTRNILIGLAAGVGMAIVGLLLFQLGKSVSFLTSLREFVLKYLVPLFAELRWSDLVFLSMVSGFCEEIFFRGVIQSQFNLFLASLMFGFFHDPSFRHMSYSIPTFLAGLLLGWLYIVTGNLWVPIMAHITHNLVSLLFLRYTVKPPTFPVEESSSKN